MGTWEQNSGPHTYRTSPLPNGIGTAVLYPIPSNTKESMKRISSITGYLKLKTFSQGYAVTIIPLISLH